MQTLSPMEILPSRIKLAVPSAPCSIQPPTLTAKFADHPLIELMNPQLYI
jgi:hypothetical protein